MISPAEAPPPVAGERCVAYLPGPATVGLMVLVLFVFIVDTQILGFSVTGFPFVVMFIGIPGLVAIYGHARALNVSFVSGFAAFSALFAALTLGGIAQYAATAHGGAYALIDAQLLAADRSMGFDWFAFNALVNKSKLASDMFLRGYNNAMPEMAALLIGFIWTRDFRGLDAFIASLLAMVAVGCIVTALYPSIGVTGVMEVSYENIPVAGGRSGQQHFLALRSGALRLIDLMNLKGLITFPSGHAAFAVATTLAARRIPYLFWPFVISNALMMFGTLTHGGHYLSDAIAGTALAIVAWRAMLSLAAIPWRPLRLAVLQPSAG